MPSDKAQYVHRLGRTARAGKVGSKAIHMRIPAGQKQNCALRCLLTLCCLLDMPGRLRSFVAL
jgi:hypothetical protein